MLSLVRPFLKMEKKPFEGAVEQEALEPGDLSGSLLPAFRQMKVAEDYVIETGLPSNHRFPRLTGFPTINQSDRCCKNVKSGCTLDFSGVFLLNGGSPGRGVREKGWKTKELSRGFRVYL